jgi:hypothetical protein
MTVLNEKDFYAYLTNQKVHIYTYFLSYIAIYQHAQVDSVTIVRVSHKNTNDIQQLHRVKVKLSRYRPKVA